MFVACLILRCLHVRQRSVSRSVGSQSLAPLAVRKTLLRRLPKAEFSPLQLWLGLL